MNTKQVESIYVVMPARNERFGRLAIQSLLDPTLTDYLVTFICVINASENDSQEILRNNNQLCLQLKSLKDYIPSNYDLLILQDDAMPSKDSGVGLARKIGMDLAFESLKSKDELGIILCYDADCLAPAGYLKSILENFIHRNLELAAIRYAHMKSEDNPAILQYELFLRYYSLSLQKAGYPYWHQTIGSSMAVRSDVYNKMGGMNKRKAGEDFYFMHKIMPSARTGTIISTCNLLSARTSDRVPFGTGKAMEDAETAKIKVWYTYHPAIFKQLKIFIEGLNMIQNEEEMKAWMGDKSTIVHEHFAEQNYWAAVQKVFDNSTNTEKFKSSFFQFFNGFKVLKYVHWARDFYFINVPVMDATKEFLKKGHINNSLTDFLKEMRQLEIELSNTSDRKTKSNIN